VETTNLAEFEELQLDIPSLAAFKSTSLALALDADLDIILNPSWDVDPGATPCQSPIRGILFTEAVQDGTVKRIPNPIIMLVRHRGDVYERMGIVELRNSVSFGMYFKDVLHVGVGSHHVTNSLRFFNRNTGKFSRVKVPEDNTTGPFNRKITVWQDYDWRKFFVEETIVLG
jgi:hypothetical protein